MAMPELRTLLTGREFVESPRWHEDRLWFCDWGTGEVIAVDLEGNSEVVARMSAGLPFCVDGLPDGRMLVVGNRDRALLRREPDGSLVTHADLTGLSEYAWNDIVVDGRGNAYVNNIGHEFGGEFAPGMVALVPPGGSARPVAGGLAFPNGMAVTPDNATLIVAESYANRLTAFDIGSDGGLANRRVWAELGENVPPDGICLDAENAVWYADVPNQRCVRVREGGEVLSTIDAGLGCFSCALGGPDRRTLFITAARWTGAAGMTSGARTGRVLAVEAPAPGAGWP
jgi:sugar lactone lactonase YvrE